MVAFYGYDVFRWSRFWSQLIIFSCCSWLAIRVEFIGICAVFFAGLFAVVGRDKDWGINAKDVGLSISYA